MDRRASVACFRGGFVGLKVTERNDPALLSLSYLPERLSLQSKNTGPGPSAFSILLDKGIVRAGQPLELTGVLARQPEAAPEGFYLTLRVDNLSWKGREESTSGTVSLLLTLSGITAKAEYDKLELRYGARIRVLTTLKRGETFRNPGGSFFFGVFGPQGLCRNCFCEEPAVNRTA